MSSDPISRPAPAAPASPALPPARPVRLALAACVRGQRWRPTEALAPGRDAP